MMCRLDDSRRTLAEKNTALVYFVLKNLGIPQSDRDYEDFVSAGNIGLCRAALLYREKGCAFSTFAFYLIKQEILQALIARGRDRAHLCAFDKLCALLPAPDCDFVQLETELLTEQFCRDAKKNLSETAAAVVSLSAQGKTCPQIAKELHLSNSAVEKAKKSARAYFEVWLLEGKCETWSKLNGL